MLLSKAREIPPRDRLGMSKIFGTFGDGLGGTLCRLIMCLYLVFVLDGVNKLSLIVFPLCFPLIEHGGTAKQTVIIPIKNI